MAREEPEGAGDQLKNMVFQNNHIINYSEQP